MDRKFAFHNPIHHEGPKNKEGFSTERILVPVNGNGSELNPSSLNALGIACDLAHLYPRSEITIVHVLEVPRKLPILAEMTDLTEKGGNLLDYAEGLVKAKHVVNVKSELLQVRAGNVARAILDEAKDKNADLIVIGTDGVNEFNIHQINPLARSILDRFKGTVVLVRSSVSGQVTAS